MDRNTVNVTGTQRQIVKRDFLFVGCEAGHDWRSLGGCNCGCHADAACSVPVNFCRRCGDCDYGDNQEADDIRANCKFA